MPTLRSEGLAADWLNAWLAAVGATVLVPGMRLRWSDDAVPVAMFSHDDEDVTDALTNAFPTAEILSTLGIARQHPHAAGEVTRNPTLEVYRERILMSSGRDDYSIACTLSDLKTELKDGVVAHGPFDPSVPKGLTLHQRLISCREDLPEDREVLHTRILETLNGTAKRTTGNGLGFDYRRIGSGVQAGVSPHVDPCVEVFAFFGIWLFPVRGNGYRVVQRGWQDRALARGAFTWPVWRDGLDRWAIDSILDLWYRAPKRDDLWGIVGGYGSISYQPLSRSDATRAFGSEALW